MQLRFKHYLLLTIALLSTVFLQAQKAEETDSIPVENSELKAIEPLIEEVSFEHFTEEEKEQLLEFIKANELSTDDILKLSYDQLDSAEKERMDIFSDFVLMSRESTPVTTIEYSIKKIDFGDFALGETKIHTIMIKNVGNQPYIITNTEHSCPCIEADYSNRAIMPGETGEIRIMLTTSGYEPVPFAANISIHDNSTPNRRTLIYTQGVIKK